MQPYGPHSPRGASQEIRLPLLSVLETGIDHFHLDGRVSTSNELGTLKTHLVLDDRHIVALRIGC